MALQTERQRIAHLLRRFGLGASEAELEYYGTRGQKGAIEALLGYADVPEAVEIPIELFLPPDKQNQVKAPHVQSWWYAKMLTTRRPLAEQMTLFWHDHFATSSQKVTSAKMMLAQNELFRANATGSFRTLLGEVSRDPAMLFWLDNQYNVAGKPNENFAREVMELFTLGFGNYTEKDVQEAARAFTGWTIGRGQDIKKNQVGQFRFNAAQHDRGAKTVLGRTGDFSGEDVLDILCAQAQTSRYLAAKMWSWFAYPDPEPRLVERLASAFRAENLSIEALLREIMNAPEFYSERAERSLYKHPVALMVTSLRQLGVGQMLEKRLENPAQGRALAGGAIAACLNSGKGMGMNLLFPPDVAGWDGGVAWVSSATMVERIKWADRLFGAAEGTGAARRLNVVFNAEELFAEDPTPMGVAKKLVSVFDAPIPSSKLPLIADAAQRVCGASVTRENANAAAAAAARLIFGSPEFQFA